MDQKLKGREVQLVARPVGEPKPSDFAVVERDVPEAADGQVVVRNLFMSVDPYMRGRMNDVKSYVPPFQLGEPLSGGAVGEVIESRAEGLPVGSGGLVKYALGTEVTDSSGKMLFKRAPKDQETLTSLGGARVPAYAQVDVGLGAAIRVPAATQTV